MTSSPTLARRDPSTSVPTPMPRPAPTRPRTARILVLLLLVAAASLLGAGLGAAPALADTSDWRTRVNDARANAGLAAITERQDWSQAAREHARFITQHGVLDHDQDPRLAGATDDGAWAARTGNLYGSGAPAAATQAVHRWLDSPSHARWVLHPGLREAGFGDHTDTSASYYVYGAVMPVVEGVDRSLPTPERVTYPGHGSVLRTHPGDGAAAAVRTLHLFRPDLDGATITTTSTSTSHPPAEALVTVDGRRVDVAGVDLAEGHLAVRLTNALPSDAEVAVVTLVDGSYDDRWTFTTSSTRSAPPLSDQVRTPRLWDVPGTTHEPAIVAIADAGIITGYRDGSFGPGRSVTRGQLATVLAGMGSLDEPATSASPYDDIDGSAHESGILAVTAAGWMQGRSDGTFRPGDTVTRGQLATTVMAALALPPAPGAAAGLSDVAGTTHQVAIEAVVAAGLAGGYPDGTFRPHASVLRGQLATVLVAADELD